MRPSSRMRLTGNLIERDPDHQTIHFWEELTKLIEKHDEFITKPEGPTELLRIIRTVPHATEACQEWITTLNNECFGDLSEDIVRRITPVCRISTYLNDVKYSLLTVHSKLLVLSGLNQAEASSVGTKRKSTEGLDDEYKMDLDYLPARLERDKNMFDETGTLEHFSDEDKSSLPLTDTSGLESSHQIALQDFSRMLQKLVQASSSVHRVGQMEQMKAQKATDAKANRKNATQTHFSTKQEYKDALDSLERIWSRG